MPTSKKPAPKKKPAAKKEKDSFPVAFAALLRIRKIPVPKGLLEAPPAAYASQPADIVEQWRALPDAELKTYATKIATFADRQRDRAKAAWEASPLIAELRRRKLKVPVPPTKVVGASVSLAKPLSKWSDAELLRAADEWSKRGR